MAVLRYFHLDPKQVAVKESSVVDNRGTTLTNKLTTINTSISNNTQAIDDKQDSIPGKSLSSNDFTNYYKDKLDHIEAKAEVNVLADWDENDSTADSYIQNKPGIDTVVTLDSDNLITSGAVFTAIDNLPEPMIFKGSLGVNGTILSLPSASSSNIGYTYKVITDGTYAGLAAKAGDVFISDGTDWIYIPSADEPSGTVTNIAMTVPTGLEVSGSPITTSGTLAITYALGYAIPTLTDQATWTAKQDAISDLATIRTNASNGNTAYGWGNHANAGYLAAISDLATIRSNASEGHTAYGWGNHANAGYVKSSGVTSVAMTVPTGLAISGSPITSTGTLALSFANGYSIPTTAKLSNWDTAYGWGNHASAGYALASSLSNYLPLAGGTMKAGVMINWADWGLWGSSSATYPKAQGGLQWNGTSDWVKLFAEEVVSDDLRLILAFGDDASPSLDIRNNTGTTTMRLLSSGQITAASFVKSGGTSSLFLKADGSVDSNSYITGITKTMVTNALGYTPPTSDTNTWRPITNTYTGSDLSTSVSLYGTNALYNALVNGYANSAGNADTVDGYHASSLVKHIPTRTISTNGTAPYAYVRLCEIGNSAAYSSVNFKLRISSRYDNLIEANIRISTGTPAYGTSSITAYVLGITYNASLYYIKSVNGAGIGYDSYYIFAAVSAWNTFSWDIEKVGYNGTAVINYMEDFTNSLNANAVQIPEYALPLSGGTMTGTIVTPADDSKGIEPATDNYGQIGSSSKKFYRMYATTFYGTTFLGTTVNGGSSSVTSGYVRAQSSGSGDIYMFSNSTNKGMWASVVGSGYTTKDRCIFTVDKGNVNVDFGDVANTTRLDGAHLWLNCKTNRKDTLINCYDFEDDSGRGYVGIGKAAPSYKLHVYGSCGATSFTNTSDERLKDILKYLSIDINDIANAPLFLFKWKDKVDERTHVGTSALYWLTKVPELVSEADDDIKTLSLEYSILGAASSIAIAKEVVSLKEEIKLLQALIAELKLLLNN